jgi:adhesin transport system outer membrane protein
MADRMIESNMRHARLQRAAFESLDKAWAARTITSDRIAALARQVDAARKVVSAYRQEYELDKRTLFDLLNAENEYFNAAVSLVSARGVVVFADYQLLAAMGQLLDYLKTPAPAEADPLDVKPFLLVPTKLPPVIIKDPGAPGPEPLKVMAPAVGNARAEAVPANPPKVLSFGDRWPESTGSLASVQRWFAQVMPGTARGHQRTADRGWTHSVSAFAPVGTRIPLP